MTAPLEIVPYTTDRLEEVLEVINLSLGEKLYFRRDADYWNWKHEENPHGRSIMLLGLRENRVMGVRAFMRWQLKWNGEIIQAAKPVDSATHPDARRQGVFSLLTKTACDEAKQLGIDLIFNTPNPNSLPGYLKLGWEDVGRLPLFVRVVKPFSLSWRLLKSQISSPSQKPPNSDFFRDEPCSASELFNQEKRLDEFLDRVQEKAEQTDNALIITPRTSQFLRWRYSGHPQINYFVEQVEANGKLVGLLFYRFNMRSGMREVMVTEVMIDSEHFGVTEKLFSQLLNRVQSEYLVAHALAGTSFCSTLKSMNFKQVPRKGFLVRIE